ncbi:DUF4139 domain-containing protein [Sphingomonas sp. LHG3406-1]|uniref:DUF4139 domain-containing protein n=1 Tax=Sphingomonas sp. LHG3406-1 TaxID=2804617 RepID=UPI00260A2603|nr:DUF4139 domain-containing protein [Sphingomonas sp. LHG3406-1]
MRLVLGLLAAAAAVPVAAQTIPAPEASAQGDVAVTIYNNDLALVQDRRDLSLPAGRSRQEFPDVSARIRAETVTLNGAGLGIVEQNFDYDLLSPAALMQKAVGETITLVRINPATGAETRERARVLAANGGVVLQIGERIEVLRDDGLPVRVIFDKVPEGLRPRPTLSVTLTAPRAGRQPVTLTYLTPGLAWEADYVALFDENAGRMDVQGWITLNNQSGTAYRNAEVVLVAGSVGTGEPQYGRTFPPPPPLREAGIETAARERLGDFYLYPLPQRTTIAQAQQKQVSFLDVSGAPAQRAYEYRNGWLGSSDQPVSVNSVLRFSTGRAQGLGDALPAGTVRVYQRDSHGTPQFVGESRIGHTPMGSDLGLTTSQAFDIKVQPTVEQRTRVNSNGSRWRTAMRYKLTNASPTPVTIQLVQSGLWGDTRILAESQKSERRSADEALWRVEVPANGEAAVTATFDTRY